MTESELEQLQVDAITRGKKRSAEEYATMLRLKRQQINYDANFEVRSEIEGKWNWGCMDAAEDQGAFSDDVWYLRGHNYRKMTGSPHGADPGGTE